MATKSREELIAQAIRGGVDAKNAALLADEYLAKSKSPVKKETPAEVSAKKEALKPPAAKVAPKASEMAGRKPVTESATVRQAPSTVRETPPMPRAMNGVVSVPGSAGTHTVTDSTQIGPGAHGAGNTPEEAVEAEIARRGMRTEAVVSGMPVVAGFEIQKMRSELKKSRPELAARLDSASDDDIRTTYENQRGR